MKIISAVVIALGCYMYLTESGQKMYNRIESFVLYPFTEVTKVKSDMQDKTDELVEDIDSIEE